MALSLTWGGRADTNVALSEFLTGNHTVAVRFMMQFVNVYAGPMVAGHGTGRYFIGYGNGGAGNNKISIRIGASALDVPIATSFKGAWHHVAVVRNGSTCTVYLDGVSKGTLTFPDVECADGHAALRAQRRDSRAVLRADRRRRRVQVGAVCEHRRGAGVGDDAHRQRDEPAAPDSSSATVRVARCRRRCSGP